MRFDLTGADDRELPLILGLMPVLPKHADRSRHVRGHHARRRIDRQRPLRGRQGRRRPQRHAQAQSELLGPRSRRSIAACGISTRSASTSTATPIRISRPSRKASTTSASKTDPGRWETAYDLPAVRDGRIVKEAFPTGLPKAHLRPRVQHPPADLRRHPRARGDRAAVRLRMAQPQFLLRPLQALGRAISRAPSSRRAAARPTRANARCSRRFPDAVRARHHGRHLAAAGHRRLRPRPRTLERALACSRRPATSFDGTVLRIARDAAAVHLRDPGHHQGPGAPGARLRARSASAPASRRGCASSMPCSTTGGDITLRFRHDRIPLGSVAVARQRAGLLLGLRRGRCSTAPATTWASKAPRSTP